jgi:hypothetical protein
MNHDHITIPDDQIILNPIFFDQTHLYHRKFISFGTKIHHAFPLKIHENQSVNTTGCLVVASDLPRVLGAGCARDRATWPFH